MSNASSEHDKEIAERILPVEQQLQEINNDIKKIGKAINSNKLSEPPYANSVADNKVADRFSEDG